MNEISKTYLRFVKSKSCVVAVTAGLGAVHRCDGPTDPHHLIARGWRESKRNDFTCISLCRQHHTEVEYGGVEKFQRDYRINLWQENSRLLIDWIVHGQENELLPVVEATLQCGACGYVHLFSEKHDCSRDQDTVLEQKLRESIKVVREKGMTLKQYHLSRFLRLCEEYREAKKHMDTDEGRTAFVVLSLQIHAAKGQVSKRWWSMVNK
jgi:hypothetical protein